MWVAVFLLSITIDTSKATVTAKAHVMSLEHNHRGIKPSTGEAFLLPSYSFPESLSCFISHANLETGSKELTHTQR